MKSLTKRTLSSLIFGPILLVGAWFGKLPLQILISIISCLGVKEFYTLLKEKKNIKIFYLFTIFCALVINWYIYFWGLEYVIFLFILFLFVILARDVLLNKTSNSISRTAYTLFTLFYIPFLLEFIFLISRLHNGNYLLIFLFILVWITDSTAYFVGARFGNHRQVFYASKNKSVEGFIAGLISAFVFAYILNIMANAILGYYLLTSWKDFLAVGLIVGIFDQIGDLVESNIKRDFGVKDTSRLIPGHGGILDRFDSLIIAAPCLYFYFSFL